MTASRSSSVRHAHEACRMRLSFSNSLYRPFFRNDIEVVHGIGGLPRLVEHVAAQRFKFVATIVPTLSFWFAILVFTLNSSTIIKITTNVCELSFALPKI